MRWFLVLLLVAAACSSESSRLDPDALTERGGCSMASFYAGNPDWTQVLEISVRREVMVEAGADSATSLPLAVGQEGVFVRIDEGRNLRNLYCNDFSEGNEEVTSRHDALSGMLRIELERPIATEFECCDESQEATIRATDLEFPGLDPFDITFTAQIGWYPG